MAVSIKKENIPKVQSAFESLFDKKIEALIIDYFDEESGSIKIDNSELKEYLKPNTSDFNEIFVAKRINTVSKSDSSKPKRAQSGYFLWLNENRGKIKDEYFSNYTLKDIVAKDGSNRKEKMVALVTKKAGELWKLMEDSEKQPYLDKSEELKQEYQIAMQNWRETNHSEEPPKPKKKRGRPPKNPNPKNEDNDGVVKVKKIEYSGDDYLLDEKSGDVYNMEQELVGSMLDNVINFSV